MSDFIAITKEGYDILVKEMEKISKVEAPEITKQIAEARLLGDLSENAEYQSAKQKQSSLLSRYSYLENIKKKCNIIELPDVLTSVVFGTSVEVKNLDTDTITKYKIVGEYESVPSENKISNKTPIARALLGKKVNDTALVELRDRIISLKILSISK